MGGGSALDSLKAQIQKLKNAYGDQFSKFRISETGWPSDGGSSPQGNAASLANAKQYADSFASLLCSGQISTDWVSYFTYFDPAYKTWAPAYERNFGISDPQGNVKWDVQSLHCSGTIPTPTPSPTPISGKSFYFKDVDFTGGDITSKASSAPEKCFDICYATSGCQSFTWTNYNGGMCWLKGTGYTRATNVGAYSGTLCALQNNKDVYGNVVASVGGVATAQGCCGVCAKNDLCGAFSWNSYNGGTCWMKAKSDGTVYAANTIGFTG